MAMTNTSTPQTLGHRARAGRAGLLLLAPLLALAFAGPAAAATAVGLGTTDSFAILGGSAVTNTGPTVINGDLGVHPGTSVTGFPPGIVNGDVHSADAVALQAQTDLVTAYNDAAGQPFDATVTSDLGGQTLTPGVYRSSSSQQLTGPLTLNAQGNPNAVFIFQIGSTLTTASASSVNLINGAQACNVYWQVGSSATLGTGTNFVGNVLALTSITANTAATVQGRLLARNGAVTLDTNTVTRSQCATGPGPGPGPGTGPGSGGGAGTTPGSGTPVRGGGAGPDRTGPVVRIIRVPKVATGNFTAQVRVRDRSGIRRVRVYLDGRRVRRTSRRRFSVRINVRHLRVGRHRITVSARDRAGNLTVTTRRFVVRRAAPRFTG